MHILLKHRHKIIHPATPPPPHHHHLELTQVARSIVRFAVDKVVLYGGEPLDVLLSCLSTSLCYHCQKEKSATYESITFLQSEQAYFFFSSFYLLPACFHGFHITAVDRQQHLTPNYCCYFHVWHLSGSFKVVYIFQSIVMPLPHR